MFLKKTIFLLNVLLLPFLANAQGNNIAIGEWRVHLPYNGVKSLALTNDKVYAASEVNAFYLDRSDNSTHILSTINALNDIELSKTNYHTGLQLLVLAYVNGNIDIIRNDNTIINVSDIKRKNIIGSKKINHIYFHNNLAYLSCDFGVSVLDLTKFEIKETYSNLAPGGMPNKIFNSTFSPDGDSIFLATEKGVMTAKNSPSVNLMDINNWYTYGPANNITTNNILAVCTINNTVFAGRGGDEICYLKGSTWVESFLFLPTIFSMNQSGGRMVACVDWGVVMIKEDGGYVIVSNSAAMTAPKEAILDGNFLWVADANKGLLKINLTDNSVINYQPNGPLTKEVHDIYYTNDKIIVSRGGPTSSYNASYKPAEYYIFDNYNWTSYNNGVNPAIPAAGDISNATYNPYDNNLYFILYGYGVLVAHPDGNYSVIDDTNAPFLRALPDPGPFTRITDVEPDLNGNIWFANAFVPLPSDISVWVKKADGSYTGKTFNLEAARYPVEILVDENNYKWIRLRPDTGGGLIVYDDKTNQYKYISDVAGKGGLPNKAVRAMVIDKKGEIWLGTDGGIAVIYNPENILPSSTYDVAIPIFDGFPLLYNEMITCIKVDGGNRKWVGTKNGLWLFNDDATEIIANFTVQNSPLLSNNITDVEIHEKTGEVFIGTDKGIISYRGTATESKKEHSNVKVFPNPVRPDFTGLVGISGLTTDAVIKITDIYGNLIYETKAEGGTAVWNAKNYNGEKANTGIYLIYSASEDGEESFVTKIAVVE